MRRSSAVPPSTLIRPSQSPQASSALRRTASKSHPPFSARRFMRAFSTPTKETPTFIFNVRCCVASNDRTAPDCLPRSEEHTSELQSQSNLVCRLLLEKKKDQRVLPLVDRLLAGREREPVVVHRGERLDRAGQRVDPAVGVHFRRARACQEGIDHLGGR